MLRALWIAFVLIGGAWLFSLRPGAPPLWTFALVALAVLALCGLLQLRAKRRARRLKGTPFVSSASRSRLSPLLPRWLR